MAMANVYHNGPTHRISWLLLPTVLRDTSGAALVEITLFMPFLVLMSVAIINFGLYFWYQIELENAVQAGAQWAINNAAKSGYLSGSIQTAGNNANNLSLPSVDKAIGITATRYCGCTSGSTLTLSSWTASCASATCGTYVQVVATCTTGCTFTPFAKLSSFFQSSYTPPLSARTATVRVQ
jgi:Flp pilus assembly protein TadG